MLVHEKSILFCCLPVAICMFEYPSCATAFMTVATISMFPLLYRVSIVTPIILSSYSLNFALFSTQFRSEFRSQLCSAWKYFRTPYPMKEVILMLNVILFFYHQFQNFNLSFCLTYLVVSLFYSLPPHFDQHDCCKYVVYISLI